MKPITLYKPKPMVEVLGKPLIEHIVSRLPQEVTELIIVVGYKGEQIVNFCGKEFYDRPVRYIWQKEAQGTARALELVRPYLKGRFMVLYADDIHGAEDLQELVKHDLSLLVYRHEHPERFGVVTVNNEGIVTELVEKPEIPKSNLVSTGPVVLDERIFNFRPVLQKGEYFLASQIGKRVQVHAMHAVPQKLWLPIGYPEDIVAAETVLASEYRVAEFEKASFFKRLFFGNA